MANKHEQIKILVGEEFLDDLSEQLWRQLDERIYRKLDSDIYIPCLGDLDILLRMEIYD